MTTLSELRENIGKLAFEYEQKYRGYTQSILAAFKDTLGNVRK